MRIKNGNDYVEIDENMDNEDLEFDLNDDLGEVPDSHYDEIDGDEDDDE